ncbi:Hypothetical_protein [Hexamita inflata]|uniref:Hypothetical_protein n=1 Tax=Hexamita inflata TaxID=28002 RepID=A0AA86PSZ5_9EUKA|nr:Hypothetical protein HINF_LOCUS28630 [Hexamita inflata]
MPFVISSEDEDRINLKWRDDPSIEKYNLSTLRQEYSYINIYGAESELTETEYELLKRASWHISIYTCTVDLSLFTNAFGVDLSLKSCICVNSANQLEIDELVLEYTTVKVSQIQQLKFNRLRVHLSQDQFDFWNCSVLTCELHFIQLSNCKIDLSNWNGEWGTIQLLDCEFEGELQIDQLKAQYVILNINYSVDLTPIYNIKTDGIEVHAYSQEENDKISLQFKQAAKIYAEIVNFTFDLNEVTEKFKQLEFKDCKIAGDPNNYINTLVDTEVTVIESQNPNIDLKALFGIKTKQLNISLQEIEIESINMVQCNANKVQFHNCSLNLNQMNGKWQNISFLMCNLKTDNNFAINASSIDIFDSDLTNFSNFSANSMYLRNVHLVKIFPQAKMLSIDEAIIECLQSNTNIKKLVLNQCTFIKFSISMFPSLVEIQVQDEQYEQLNLQLNQLLKEKNKALKNHFKNAQKIEKELVQYLKNIERKLKKQSSNLPKQITIDAE